MIKRKIIIPIIVLSLLILAPTSASATPSSPSSSGKIVIGFGRLTMDQPDVSEFTPVTLTGELQTATANIGDFRITDGRGTGEGWKIMITATQFTDNQSKRTIPQDSVEIAAPGIKGRGGASEVSTIIAYSGTIDNPVGLKLFSAAKNGGMGKYDIDPTTIKITLLPKNTFAGTYTSTLTFNIITGP